MYKSKGNSDFSSPSHLKSPYSRMGTKAQNATVAKILAKTRPPINNFERHHGSAKHLGLRNSYGTQKEGGFNSNDDFKMYDEKCFYENVNGVHGAMGNFTRNSHDETVHFRPRKAVLSGRMVHQNNSNEHSVSQVNFEMMNIGSDTENSEALKKKSYKYDNAQELTKKENFRMKNQENLRVFTGTVENLLQWSKLKNNVQILFEITATLDSVQSGKWQCEKILFLRDSKTSSNLQVFYYEVDRALPKMAINSTVTCIGRLLTRNSLQAFKVEETNQEKTNYSERLSFICNRVAEEILASGIKK